MLRFNRNNNKLRVDRNGKAATINLLDTELLLDDNMIITNRIKWYTNGCDYNDFMNIFGLDDTVEAKKMWSSCSKETRKLIRNFGADMMEPTLYA